jgi:hypothetical protein
LKQKDQNAMNESRPRMSLDQRVQALAYRRQIEELRATYGWHAARGDAKGVASCFTEDCLYEGPAGAPGKRDTVRTRVGLESYLAARLKPGAQVPFLYNHIIRVDGEVAEGNCAIKPHVQVGQKQMVGFYEEKLKRVSNRWLIHERRFYLYEPYSEI